MAEGSRVARMFEGLRGKRAALIAYATGYYPDEGRCREVITTMLDAGADAIEIGIPFSDPVMDGPVIQESSTRGLMAGATPSGVLDMVSELRGETERPLLVMTYYNPVFKFGPERFVRRASASGVDGIVIPDLPAEEMGPFKAACDAEGIATVAFCSMTTPSERIREADGLTTGFLYCVSVLGPTGARESVSSELPTFLERVRENASCPLAVGLGISTPEQCARIGAIADGVIVGSALVRQVAAANGDYSGLSALVNEMTKAIGARAGS